MIVIPAIDLKDGKCVRLKQGDFNRVTVYCDHPLEIARKWQAGGAEIIHVVDLDGSRAGAPRNLEAIRDIAEGVSVPVEVGGGIRDMATVEAFLGMGVARVVLGTSALKQRQFVIDACALFRGRIVIGIDSREGETLPWRDRTEATGASAIEAAKSYEAYSLPQLFTQISGGTACRAV